MDKKTQRDKLESAASREALRSHRLTSEGKPGQAQTAWFKAQKYRKAAAQLAKELGER